MKQELLDYKMDLGATNCKARPLAYNGKLVSVKPQGRRVAGKAGGVNCQMLMVLA